MKGIGVYGSELKVGRLLRLPDGASRSPLRLVPGGAAGSFRGWRPGELIDLEGHASREHSEPLVVVDPVDPARNVAAALTMDKMFQFVAASRCFLARPSLDFFFPRRISRSPMKSCEAIIESEEAALILVEFQAPAVVEDVLFPQLRQGGGVSKGPAGAKRLLAPSKRCGHATATGR